MGTMKEALFDKLLLVVSAIILAGALVILLSVSEHRRVNEAWTWGTWFGVGSFVCVAGFLRSKFRRKGFVLFCLGWFPVHMVVMFAAAARFQPITSILPVTAELWIGFTVAFWLYGRSPQGKK